MPSAAPPAPSSRRVRRVRNGAAGARWEAVIGSAHPRLAPWLAGDYHGWVESAAEPFCRLEAPSDVVPLILNLGAPFLVVAPGDATARRVARTSFTAGLADAYALTESVGTSRGVQVNLTPLGAYAILGLPMDALTNRVLDLEEALGAAGRDLLERLGNAPSWEARFDLLDHFLQARIERGRRASREIAWAWGRLSASRGGAPIGELARELGWSHRRLIARFREQVGLPPKTAGRVLRFHRAVETLRAQARVDWADLALGCGYFDQAHLIRDFRAFAGVTPAEFQRRCLPEGGGVLGA